MTGGWPEPPPSARPRTRAPPTAARSRGSRRPSPPSLDLEKADETLKAFTKDAAMFKIEEFAAASPYGFTSTDAAMEELVGKLGYSKFLEMSTKQLMKQWATLHPDPKAAKKEEKK